jgi:hypothetical protein
LRVLRCAKATQRYDAGGNTARRATRWHLQSLLPQRGHENMSVLAITSPKLASNSSFSLSLSRFCRIALLKHETELNLRNKMEQKHTCSSCLQA